MYPHGCTVTEAMTTVQTGPGGDSANSDARGGGALADEIPKWLS